CAIVGAVGRSGETAKASPYPLKFTPPQEYSVGNTRPQSVAIADVTGDGLRDVLMSTTQWSDPQNAYKLFLFRQQIDGSLAPPQRFTPEGSGGYDGMGVATGDIDGDGLTDVVLATVAGVNVFLQRGGSLAAPVLIQQTAGASDVEVADLNGDGRNDVVIRGAGIEVARNTGLGFSVTAVTTESATEVEVGDVTGDARADLVTLHGIWGQAAIDLQNSRGTLQSSDSHLSMYEFSTNPKGIAAGDINSDGLPDIVVAGTRQHGLFVLRQVPHALP